MGLGAAAAAAVGAGDAGRRSMGRRWPGRTLPRARFAMAGFGPPGARPPRARGRRPQRIHRVGAWARRGRYVAGEGPAAMLGPARTPKRTPLDDLNQLVTPSLGAIIRGAGASSPRAGRARAHPRAADVAARPAHRAAHARRRRRQPGGHPRRAHRQGLRRRPRGRRAGGPDGGPGADAAVRVPAPRPRALQPVRGHGRQPELRARAARRSIGDGFVVSSLHTRTATRVYGKAIAKGKAEAALSDEEAEALRIALASGAGTREGLIPMRPVTPELARARPILASCLLPTRPLPPSRRSAPRCDTRTAPGAPREAPRAVAGSRSRSSRSRSGARRRRPPRTARSRPGTEQLLEGLNPEQRRAVTHGDGPLLVVAGAGTGKTQVITRRIAWLIATRRARPSEILALTFTDQAADEMQTRVDQLVPYGYTDTAISTFHAFGDRLIREFALELGLPLGRAGVLAPGDGGVPAGARVRARRWTSTGRSATRRSSWTRSRRCSRGPRTRTSRPTRSSAHADAARGGGGRRRARRRTRTRTPSRRWPRRRAGAGSWRGPTPRYQRAARRRTGRSTSGTRSRWRCGSCASRRPGAGAASSGASSTCSWTSSRTRTAPSRSSWRWSPSGTAT